MNLVRFNHCLYELFIIIYNPSSIYCDSIRAIYLCANIFHSQMKHIVIDFRFVYDKVQNGEPCVSQVSFSNQLADAITKYLFRHQFLLFRSKIDVSDRSILKKIYLKNKS